ncbi:MAG: hypothetical protein M1814_006200 [Vezdaea aestivalis]|nr:MAG: hypothetical protein M1814_006200 [Vezdaea aestivalis]
MRRSIFWIVDGLDEAESPCDLLKLLSKIRSFAKVNFLIISRPTKNLSRDISDLLPTMVHERITALDTVEDIRAHVRLSVQKILPTDKIQEEIVQDILSKASGSFLWVKLVLDNIRDNWYTKDNIRTALNELPVGMEPLYEKMINIISQQPEKTRVMATRILTWIACAFLPLTIADLEEALKPEFKDFVNLRNAAEEICGHFIVVNESRVTLIHQTARQFLLRKTSNLSLTLSEHGGHKHAATASTSGGAIFDGHPFLRYALFFWAYHVSLASVDSNKLLDIILSFLEEYCLLWINGIALTKDLRILTRAAQHLKTYIRRRTQKASKEPSQRSAMARDSELLQWANDIIRIVARFGANLAESPNSIYKHVVPFCPKESIIVKTFSAGRQSGFSVKGLSSQTWNDCLARLSMGNDQVAAKLLCKDTFFITLLAASGTMVLWRAETCEEVQRITHGEYVTQIASCKTSNLVATAGFKSTRVWDITTGTELHCLPKERHHHTKALAFGEKDEEILIAYDDCVVQCIDLKTSTEKWRFTAKEPGSHDFSCARHVAFSTDRLQVAIVFRGRPVVAWSVQNSSSTYIAPRRCVLAEDRLRSTTEGDAWNAPEVALWHPMTNHLLILYEDTKIAVWNIADDEQLVYDHTAARAMTLSHDGNFLLTSDFHGTLSVWVIPEYRLAYQMKYDEPVTDLAFSPDGSRLYDLRGSFCNVWEPDALVRADDIDHDNLSSSYETFISEPVMSSDDNSQVLVTSLACDSSDRLYCVGKEDGGIAMYTTGGEKVRKLLSHSSSVSVIKLAWSTSEKYFASADDSGKVIVKRLKPPTADKDRWAVFPVCDTRTQNNDAVEHFLFHTLDEYLLIGCSSYVCVVNMKLKKEVCRTSDAGCRKIWLNHPTDNSTLVHVDESTERQYLWKTLEPKFETSDVDSKLSALSLLGAPKNVEQAVQIRHQWLILNVQESGGAGPYQGSGNRCFELLDLAKLKNAAAPSEHRTRRHVVEGLAKHIRQLVGCFQDRVVFLDHQFWLCTWEMEPVYSKHKRHFFLPKDWVSPTAVKLIALNKQGTLLCPRNGEVAVVRSRLSH